MKQFLFAAVAISTLTASASCWARDVRYDRIRDNTYAAAVCPRVCVPHGGWSGNWTCSKKYDTLCWCGCRK